MLFYLVQHHISVCLLELVEFFDNAILILYFLPFLPPLELVEFFDNAIFRRAQDVPCYSLELVEFFDNAIF